MKANHEKDRSYQNMGNKITQFMNFKKTGLNNQ